MSPPAIAVAATLLWLVLALVIPRLPLRHTGATLWLLALAGVPVLGLLTLHWGPGPGFGGFALGLLVLARAPLRRRAAAVERTQRRGS
jgi:hypothetical protein